MTPPDIDQGEFASKMIITAPMTWDKVKRWEESYIGNRGKEYEEWKTQCAEELLSRMEEIYPDLRDCIEDINTASPLTIRDWYAVKEGAMCGYSKDCNNIMLSQVPIVTKVKNLLLTGQNCNVHGFCGVPLTAINTSEVILGRNYVLDKINLKENDE
jgi:phytoene dehydrogenase-like protein